MDISKIFKQASVYGIGNLARRAIGFIMIPIYTNYLSPENYGVLELLEVFSVSISIMLGFQALSGSMVRIYYEYNTKKDRKSVVSTAIFISLMFGGIVAICGWLNAGFIAKNIFGNEGAYSVLVKISFVSLFFSIVNELYLVYLRILDKAKLYVTISVTTLAVNLFLNIILIVVYDLGVLGFVLSKLVTVSGTFIFLSVFLYGNLSISLKLEAVKRMLTFGLPLIFVQLGFFTIHFSDRYIINYYSNLSDVGLFSFAFKIAFMLTYFISDPFYQSWNVKFYEYTSESGWQKQFERIITYFMLFLFIGGLFLSMFANEVIRFIADESYFGASVFVPLLIMAQLSREIGDFFKSLLYINKRMFFVIFAITTSSILYIILSFVFIGKFGTIGAAFSKIMAWTLYMYLCLFRASKEYNINFPFKAFIRIFSICLTAYMLSQFISLQGIIEWITDSVFFIVALITIWLSKYFSIDEKTAIKATIKRYFSHLQLVNNR